jgi:hypothetical protein
VTAGITGATRVYLHLAHPSAHARTPQVMNAEFDLILDFLGLSGNRAS